MGRVEKRASGFVGGARRVALLSIAAFAAVAACSDFATDPSSGVTLRTDRESYAMGDTARLTLYNGYRRSIEHSPYWCDLEIDRWEGGEATWERVWTARGAPCIAIAETVRSGGHVSEEIPTDHSGIPGPGRYRFLKAVSAGSPVASLTVHSNPFEIVP